MSKVSGFWCKKCVTTKDGPSGTKPVGTHPVRVTELASARCALSGHPESAESGISSVPWLLPCSALPHKAVCLGRGSRFWGSSCAVSASLQGHSCPPYWRQQVVICLYEALSGPVCRLEGLAASAGRSSCRGKPWLEGISRTRPDVRVYSIIKQREVSKVPDHEPSARAVAYPQCQLPCPVLPVAYNHGFV